MRNIKAIVFDAYGTLYDVNSVVAACEAIWPGKGQAVSQLWRAKQLEYSWLRALMQRYENFRLITEAALRYATRAMGLAVDDATRAHLMEQYLHLQPFPEVLSALMAVKPGRQLVIFSNGSPDLLGPLVVNTGLDRVLDGWISADENQVYKPDPGSYALVTQKLGLTKEQILFISSNPWDVAGSKSFGFNVAWINRSGTVFDELGVGPDLILHNLQELGRHLQPDE